MTLSLDILAARMRQGESIPLGDTARVARHPSAAGGHGDGVH